MNYYERHLGDYARDASHLTMLEHGAYTLLLDRYYTTEQGIPVDQAHRVCRARTRDEKEAVDTVLAEFFTLIDGCWVNGRASREVAKMQAKVKAAQENGKRGGRPKRTGAEPTGNQPGSESVTQQKAHQSPVTSSVPDGTGATAPTDRDVVFAAGVAMLTAAGVPDKNARSFLAMQCKAHGEAVVRAALDRCAEERPIEPVGWLQAALKAKPAGPAKSKFAAEREAQVGRWLGSASLPGMGGDFIDAEEASHGVAPAIR